MTILNSEKYKISYELELTKAVLETSLLAKEIGFSSGQQNIIATITSELGRNILNHASRGTITLRLIENDTVKGIEIFATDNGPGIEDMKKAMQEGFSTKKSLGLGLPAVNRMADELKIETERGKGTSITVRKWLHNVKN